MGSILANLFMANHSKLIEKVVFTSPGPLFPLQKGLEDLEPPDSLQLIEPTYSNREGNKKAYNIRSIVMLKMANVFGSKLAADEEADNFATFLNASLSKSTVKDTTLKSPMEAGAGFYSHVMTLKSLNYIEDMRSPLEGIQIPVLIMKGQYDSQKWGYTSEYIELYSNHKLVIIPDAGHSIVIEKPALYIKTIRNFLNQ